MRTSRLLLIVGVRSEKGIGMLVEGNYGIVGRQVLDVGDSVTVWCHADGRRIPWWEGNRMLHLGKCLGVRHGHVI
jgi:hypothetical protein